MGKSARTSVITTQGGKTIQSNVAAVFGSVFASSLEALAVESGPFKLSGFVSSANKSGGKSASPRQFFFVNGRPVDHPKAVKILNESYKYASYQ